MEVGKRLRLGNEIILTSSSEVRCQVIPTLLNKGNNSKQPTKTPPSDNNNKSGKKGTIK